MPKNLNLFSGFYSNTQQAIQGSNSFNLSKQANLISWKKLFFSIVIWVVSEIVLGYVGLDNFADYSEFILERRADVILTLPPPIQFG